MIIINYEVVLLWVAGAAEPTAAPFCLFYSSFNQEHHHRIPVSRQDFTTNIPT